MHCGFEIVSGEFSAANANAISYEFAGVCFVCAWRNILNNFNQIHAEFHLFDSVVFTFQFIACLIMHLVAYKMKLLHQYVLAAANSAS